LLLLLAVIMVRLTIKAKIRAAKKKKDELAIKRLNKSKITVFKGEKSPFSNLYKADFKIGKQTFHSVAQFLQYNRAILNQDYKTAHFIQMTNSAKKAMALGMKMPYENKNSHNIWKYSDHNMVRALKAKFMQNTELARILCETKGLLAWQNPDSYWGTGFGKYDIKKSQNQVYIQ
jgi:ribA/ribD-fused uncharacterized protein